jgi:hypothetical protein
MPRCQMGLQTSPASWIRVQASLKEGQATGARSSGNEVICPWEQNESSVPSGTMGVLSSRPGVN